MELKRAGGFNYAFRKGGGDDACIYYIGVAQQFDGLARALAGLSCDTVLIVIDNWDDDLTPWPAPGLYQGDADFRGLAAETLGRLVGEAVPAIEGDAGVAPTRRAIAGYSLGGLFSLYAFANNRTFDAVASMSGSFWYPGWVDYLHGLKSHPTEGFAYLSLGDRERAAREPILHSVQANTEATVGILNGWGVKTQWRLVPGNHFQHADQRVRDGLAALASWFAAGK